MWTPPPLPSPARRERPSSASTLGDAFGAIYARYKCIPADPSLPSLILARYNEHYKATFGRMRLPHYVKIENFHRMVVDAMVLFFNFERRFPHLSKGDRLGLCEALLFEARMQSDEGCAEEELCVEGEINRWWNLFPGLPPSGTPPPGTSVPPLGAIQRLVRIYSWASRLPLPGAQERSLRLDFFLSGIRRYTHGAAGCAGVVESPRCHCPIAFGLPLRRGTIPR
ncbi:hypothetical protein FN846DRAFT_915185 [Sphaerosporella brunnea]|uniref:Uncharacterized protein n=1 Tax=Sphaerosporella brunnea TaxID=1250544 RepID=A0A5J5EC32_9PEZI|nr:hypothetical protein FN846DRAFT_915185 [Sphaerosporella brunnea]